MGEAVADAAQLAQLGYVQLGKWNLAQICEHLTYWLRYPVDGYPTTPFPLRAILWVLRQTIAKGQLRQMLRTGVMPAGSATLSQTIPAVGKADVDAVAEFREAVQRFESFEQPFHPSPLFGQLDRATSLKLQLIHCQHHLSFLVPKTVATGSTGETAPVHLSDA